MTYAYNRLGQNTSVVQGAGGTALSTLLDRCVCGKVTRETLDPTFFGSQILTYKLDSTGVGTKGRTTGFQLGVPDSPALYADFTYDYDTLGRFQSLHQGSSYEFVNYTYVPNSGLIQAVEVPGGSQLFTYDDHRDHLKSVQSNAGRNLARVQYQIDALGRRTSALHDGELFARFSGGGHHSRYGYNDRSEVTSAQSWTGLDLNNESPVSALGGRKFDFEFDPIGNRTTSQVDNRVTAYTPNELNQYASRTVPRAVDVTGLAAATASVTVNGAAASRVGDYFYSTQTAPSNAAAWLTANIAATPGGTQTRNVYVPATPEIFVYDLDGNLTADSRWTYTWDAENRLTSMETMVAAYSVGVPRQFLSFKYDYLGRRIRKTVANWNGTAYVAAVDRKFIYDGWNLIAECDALTTLTMVRTYTWGLDISRTLADAGGVHGLLLVRDWATGQSHRTVYDGNGNLLGLVETASGAVSAQYEYSPFGETIRATGSYAAANPFRFSTKFTDDESGLVYYGSRYYDPKQGRFVGRDTIEEKGGIHLYAFVRNRPVNTYDVMGNIGADDLQNLYADGGSGGDDPIIRMKPFVVLEDSHDKIQRILDRIFSQNPMVIALNKGMRGTGDGGPPEKSPYDGLPPCSEIQAKMMAGNFKPTIAVQSFIENPTAFGFTGDNRGFTAAPANGVDQTFRTSLSYTFGDQGPVASQGVSSVALPIPLLGGIILAPGAIARTGTPFGTASASVNGDGVYTFSFAVAGSDGLLPLIAPPATQSGFLTINYSTGEISGSINHTTFPAVQVFVDGRSVYSYSANQANTTPADLAGSKSVTSSLGNAYACDPRK